MNSHAMSAAGELSSPNTSVRVLSMMVLLALALGLCGQSAGCLRGGPERWACATLSASSGAGDAVQCIA